MELIFAVLTGLLIGGVVGIFIERVRQKAISVKIELLNSEIARLTTELKDQTSQNAALNDEKTSLLTLRERLASDVEHLSKQLEKQEQKHEEELLLQQKNYEEQKKTDQENATRLREEANLQWAQQLETLKQEVQKLTVEQLSAKQSSLQEHNRLQIDELLKPVKEQFAEFKKSIEESKTQGEVNKKELQSTFETTLKLFRQEQQQTVASLKEQTALIGSDATNLTKALKGESKIQGDWGEMVLETILENSGLRRDEEFFIQESVKDDNGKSFRPDVVVKFPEGRSVVIDAKVSLTAYANAVITEDEEEQNRLLREHARSVRKHVDELSEKDYAKTVPNAIGFVLMFVPNEYSYIAAMKQQPDLSHYAYQKHIIIISPSNLLMALQLAYNLWQYDRQNKNVEKIVKSAADLYDKVAGFADTFDDVEEQITKLSATFGRARKQLYDGTGNVMRRVELLKDMGVVPKKQNKTLAR